MPGRRTPYTHAMVVSTLTPRARTGSEVGATVDRVLDLPGRVYQWFKSALLVVHAGTITDGTHTFRVDHSDNMFSGYDPVPAQYLQGADIELGSSESDQVFAQGYVGPKRFLRATVSVSGATTGGICGAVIIVDDPDHPPIRP